MAAGVVSAGVEEPIEHADRAKAPAMVRVRAAVIFFLVLSMMCLRDRGSQGAASSVVRRLRPIGLEEIPDETKEQVPDNPKGPSQRTTPDREGPHPGVEAYSFTFG
ncbi:hypothetical protein GCM10009806_05100 [Microbacterium flavum]